MTLGSHGDAMIALPRHATVNGTPLPELVDEPTLDRLFQRTRDGGAEIVALLKKGSAYYAPSASITQMVAAIANDTHEVLPGLRVGDGAVRDRGRVRRRAGEARSRRRRGRSSSST